MYSLHKVLFLAIMTITLYFNEVKSFAQNMLNNSPEVSGDTQCATFMGVKVLQTVPYHMQIQQPKAPAQFQPS